MAAPQGEWLGLGHREPMPDLLLDLPDEIQAVGYDESSCGVYWLESDQEDHVTLVIDTISAWWAALSESPREVTSPPESDFS